MTKQPTPADELRQAADTLSPDTGQTPTLTGEYPNLDACYAHMLRSAAATYDAATKGRPGAVDETAYWLAPALAAARQINSAANTTMTLTVHPDPPGLQREIARTRREWPGGRR